jgi:hypothetical protein
MEEKKDRYEECVKRFEALENKVFNGLDSKIEALMSRIETNTKLIILILTGVVFSILIPIIKSVLLGQ